MRITSGGDVGVGTSNPYTKLHIYESGTRTIVSSYYNNNSSCYSAYHSSTTTLYAVRVGAEGNNMIFSVSPTSSPSERMRITSNGEVGIGTSAPSNPLEVGISNTLTGVSIYAVGDIVAFSDKSVKENIRPIENVIERIQNSRGVVYDRIDSGAKDNIGFIAQELEENFPELVTTNEDGTKAVKYQNTVAVLFEAIKEQQKQIDELKNIINGLTK